MGAHEPIFFAPAFRHLSAGRSDNVVSLPPDVVQLLANNCVVAIGVSGGKDSDACAVAVHRHLEQIGHTGPRVLVHADLGRVEWKDSLPGCERLAAVLGWELLVVRRRAGDMLARWQGRWANNVARYSELSCVKLILPWSTPAMRFCTSELKVDVITSALKKRFPKQNIINVAGIRRQESENRRRMPVSAPQAKLQRKGYAGLTWNAIIEWPVEDVLSTIQSAGLRLHEAYDVYGASRVSCAFCIMSSLPDLAAAISCADNHELYVRMVELEAESAFAFQGGRWLGDLAPHLLSTDLRERVAKGKLIAVERNAVEAELPKHLLYTAGWPSGMPTDDEADLIASVRQRVATLMGLNAGYLTAAQVKARYEELLAKRKAPATTW
jgi:3'-phosphoadenosine 5'-phosphosulfate sulfotransferase (PAPS reductase)/FAD synthetase